MRGYGLRRAPGGARGAATDAGTARELKAAPGTSTDQTASGSTHRISRVQRKSYRMAARRQDRNPGENLDQDNRSWWCLDAKHRGETPSCWGPHREGVARRGTVTLPRVGLDLLLLVLSAPM